MRKLISAILFGIMILSLCSCGSMFLNSNYKLQKEVIYPKAIAFHDNNANLKLRERNPVEKNFITAINAFSYNTAQVLLNGRTDNFNYSPLSIYYALALAGIGAGGETQQQIFKLLEYRQRRSFQLNVEIYIDFFILTIKYVNLKLQILYGWMIV